MLRILNVLRLNQQQQGDLLSSLVPLKTAILDPEQPLFVPEPLDSRDQLEALENAMTPDREKQLVSILRGHLSISFIVQ